MCVRIHIRVRATSERRGGSFASALCDRTLRRGRRLFPVGPFRARQSEFARARPPRENGQRRVAGFERIFARRFVNPVVRDHVDVCRHFLARRTAVRLISQGNLLPWSRATVASVSVTRPTLTSASANYGRPEGAAKRRDRDRECI